jgi:hypothetical protein
MPVVDSPPIRGPAPPVTVPVPGEDIDGGEDGGEDDIIAGGEDEVVVGGICPRSPGAPTFGGRGNQLYMPIVAFPCSSTDISRCAMPRWKNASVKLALSKASRVALRFCSTDCTTRKACEVVFLRACV